MRIRTSGAVARFINSQPYHLLHYGGRYRSGASLLSYPRFKRGHTHSTAEPLPLADQLTSLADEILNQFVETRMGL